MSRQDPGAAAGAGAYPQDPDCATEGCGHAATLHEFGRRGGQLVRTACSASDCRCALYVADAVEARLP